jgi:hypothetical protein
MHSSIARYLRPLASRRDKRLRQQIEAVRERDGDNCRRCRRPMRFDLPNGHDAAPKLEQIGPGEDAATATLENLCLCHRRCNAEASDNTVEVLARVQQRAGAAVKRSSGRKRSLKRAAA